MPAILPGPHVPHPAPPEPSRHVASPPCPDVSGAESGEVEHGVSWWRTAAHRQALHAKGAASGVETGGSDPRRDGNAEQGPSSGRASLSGDIFGGHCGAGARDAVTRPTAGGAAPASETSPAGTSTGPRRRSPDGVDEEEETREQKGRLGDCAAPTPLQPSWPPHSAAGFRLG